MQRTDAPILEAKEVTKIFPRGKGGGTFKALNKVNLAMYNGDCLAVVGESGCGKSTLAKIIMNLLNPDGGEILFKGEKISGLTGKALFNLRAKIQMIFQDPSMAVNPRMRVKDIVAEPLVNFKRVPRGQRRDTVAQLLNGVGLNESFLNRHPHSMSGGQLQRVSIARAIALKPEIIVCDEATSALDVSIQKVILDLLSDLSNKEGVQYVFICHDIALADDFSNVIMVMYKGHVVEFLRDRALKKSSRHPYTKLLLDSVFPTNPKELMDEKESFLNSQGNELREESSAPQGCVFYHRCPQATDECPKAQPPLV
ncbi:MAG: ATP-binding cassette domain-containing protein, partial [Deltaproteobacteria bacterium]|nr:ATP-binding cassette domain-containing protein [Deltaproteobacteria bacterium]